MQLNPQQQEAVDTIDGALLILAGAGTGKTRVIVQRIDNMLRKGIPATSIMAVTFTNKAAKEMQERVAALGSIRSDEMPTISTFHSFCISVLRHHASFIGYPNNFTMATEGYQKGLLRSIALELNLINQLNMDPYTWLSAISLAKADMLSPAQLAEKQKLPNAELISKIYEKYQEKLKIMGMMDFDDLLTNTVKLWNERPDCLKAYQEHYRFLMIDEYQDTNKVQLELMVKLAGTEQNVCAVGDDDQSIYGWRGASQQNILDFETFFPKAKIIRLEQNYRSTNTILKAANALIGHNSKRRVKNLWSAQGEGEHIIGVRAEDGKDEANYIATEITNLAIGEGPLISRNRDWSKYAILYRTSGQSRLLEEALRARRIPYVIIGSKAFYQRKEILDIISMLELVANPKNDMALQRIINVPPRGIGEGTLEKLNELKTVTHQSLFNLIDSPQFINTLSSDAAANIRVFKQAFQLFMNTAGSEEPVYPRVQKLLNDIRYVDNLINMYKPRSDALQRKDNVMEFLTSVSDFDRENKYKATLQNFIDKVALQDATDRREKDKDVTENAVNLMTIHASKGLEFPVVFLVGFEQGLFPHQMAIDEGSLEEERRLCYVAITRAKKQLYITYADKRGYLNSVTAKRPSMFLNEIPDDFIRYISSAKDARTQHNTTDEQNKNYFDQLRAMFK